MVTAFRSASKRPGLTESWALIAELREEVCRLKEDVNFMTGLVHDLREDSWAFRLGLSEGLAAQGVEMLQEGDYDCTVATATLARIARKKIVLRVGVMIGNVLWNWTMPLDSQEAVNTACADLAALGFDSNRWGPAHGRPLSLEIPKAVSGMPGVRFRGRKTRWVWKVYRTRPAVVHHDFRVLCRIEGRPMPSCSAQRG